MKNARRWAGLLLLALAVAGLPGCHSPRLYVLENLAPEADISVDGRADDWRGALSMIEGSSASLGVSNDEEDLFVCLVTLSSLLEARIMYSGLTVWFDPHGGNKRVLGIRYPGQVRDGGTGDRASPTGSSAGNSPGLEIIRRGSSDLQPLETARLLGIEARLARTSGILVYELKVPLLPSLAHPLAVGAPPGQLIGVGIDTTDPDRGRAILRPLGGLPPMGGGGGWAKGGYDMTPKAPKGLKIWGLVQLRSARLNPIVALRCE